MITAFMPHWTRKTENFGVSIPEDLYDRKDFKKMRNMYTIILLSLNVIFVGTMFMIARYFSEKTIFTALLIFLIIIILISFLLYLPYHYRMKRIKLDENWAEQKEEVMIIDTSFSKERLIYSNYWFLIAIGIVLFTTIYTFSVYEQIPDEIPTHTSFSGEITYQSKSIGILLMMPILQLFMISTFFFINFIIKRSKQMVGVQNPEISKRQNIIFRRRWSLFMILFSVVTTLMLSFIQFTFMYPVLTEVENYVIYPVIIITLLSAIMLSITTGQGGSRIQIEGTTETSRIERDDDQYWKLGQFYFNKEDPSIFIEKRFGIGWTNNWAHPISWLLLGLLIAIPLFIVFIFR